jgi:hypothetical protein
MGKSIRSKIKKRLRTAKRQRVDAMICLPREKEKNAALRRVSEGRQVIFSKPRNAFKYPDAKDAVFPQHEIMKPIDFRSENLPMAGYAFRGNRRKYDGDQKEYMQSVAKVHPKMEIMAGGGAVLAATGEKVSRHKAELLATQHRNPAAAAAASAPPSAASAVAAALEEDLPAGRGVMDTEEDVGSAEEAAAEPEPTPENAADHSRRPVLKDDRRAKRTAAHRPRAKQAASKRGGKVGDAFGKPAAVKKSGKTKAGSGDKMAD